MSRKLKTLALIAIIMAITAYTTYTSLQGFKDAFENGDINLDEGDDW